MEFNTVAISDGITMGTKGMKASLVSREVIADSIELMARGYQFDAVVALAACDKTIPGAVMALARLDIPACMLYGGSIAPGRWHGKDVTIVDVFEAIGAHAAGEMTDEELRSLEDVASPGAGACGGQFTANTMACAFEALGISPGGSAMVPAEDDEKATVAEQDRRAGDAGAGRRPAPEPGDHPRRRSRTRSPASAPRAARPTASCTCSRSPARPGSSSTIDDFERISRADPAARRPEAGRPLRRHRPLPRRRRAADPQPARRARAPALRTRSRSAAGRSARRPPPRSRPRARRSCCPPTRRSRPRAGSRSCAATSRRTAP